MLSSKRALEKSTVQQNQCTLFHVLPNVVMQLTIDEYNYHIKMLLCCDIIANLNMFYRLLIDKQMQQ